MTSRFGIDASILLHLVTGDPEDDYNRAVSTLSAAILDHGREIFASNQVIAEAYVALRQHYGTTESEARDGLSCVLRSGLVAPLNPDCPLERRCLPGEPRSHVPLGHSG